MKIVEYMTMENYEGVRRLYESNDFGNPDIDEMDLIIFRLMGAKFEYSAIVFKD